MDRRDQQRPETHLQAGFGLAGLSGALLLVLLGAADASAARNRTCSSAEARWQETKLDQYDRLEQKLLQAGPEQVEAARDELIAWLEALEKATFGGAAYDAQAL